MFHPVGSQSSSVYWRRRLLAAGSLVILIVLVAVTISALSSGGSGPPSGSSSRTPVAAGDSHSDDSPTRATSAPADTTASRSQRPSDTTSRKSSTATASAQSSSPSGKGSGTETGSATVEKCHSSQLAIAAVVKQQSYRVGQDPTVELRVTNDGTAPCVQDLADKQVVLKVYNGVSRVWGSHDCQIQPGTKKRTLAVGAPVQVSVSWSGETSQPGCSGTRQHVGAGTYTLYAALSGKTGTAARFTIS